MPKIKPVCRIMAGRLVHLQPGHLIAALRFNQLRDSLLKDLFAMLGKNYLQREKDIIMLKTIFFMSALLLLSSYVHGQSTQPDYQMPYGKIKPEDVKFTLD